MPVPPSADNDRSPEVPMTPSGVHCRGCGARITAIAWDSRHEPDCPEDDDPDLPNLIAPEAMFDPYEE